MTPLQQLGGGFKYFPFSPLSGEDFQFDEHIFQMGWFNHQPDNGGLFFSFLRHYLKTWFFFDLIVVSFDWASWTVEQWNKRAEERHIYIYLLDNLP